MNQNDLIQVSQWKGTGSEKCSNIIACDCVSLPENNQTLTFDF